jgi:LPXTG-motif cell wall-anchored protein
MSSRALLAAALCALGVLLPSSAALAQSEDTSGADQYTEQGIPGAPAPTEPDPEPAPTPTPAPAPTPSAPATIAQTDDAVADAAAPADTLPHTGLETGLVALIALGLLVAGILVRRLPAWQDPLR